MASETSPRLKVSIWRNLIPKRALIARDSESKGYEVMDSDSNLQEEVYSWHLSEDPFDGIDDPDIRLQLREHLFGRLDAARPPSERGLNVLDKFITTAEEVIGSGGAEWTAGQSRSDDDENDAGQVNVLLALTLHLKWLSGCFANRPGISVSIR